MSGGGCVRKGRLASKSQEDPMRYGLIVFAVTVLCAGMLVSAAYAGTGGGPASLKAAMETQSPAETIGCRANGRKCPIGSQEECKDGRCTCRPCPY